MARGGSPYGDGAISGQNSRYYLPLPARCGAMIFLQQVLWIGVPPVVV
jgi:hypothetical protein